MTTMTLAEFQALVARSDWKREQHIEVRDRDSRPVEDTDDDGEAIERAIRYVLGEAYCTSTLDGVAITYNEGWSYDENDPDSFQTSVEGLERPWTILGVEVLDEDGKAIHHADLRDYLPDAFSDIDYAELENGICEITDIDYDKASSMETYILDLDNEPSLRFSGILLAEVKSSDDQAMGSSYSGQTGRWTELALYKTRGGRYICHQIGHTRWIGERTRYSGKVCATVEEVTAFFGHRWLAKELYQEAGIMDVQEIE